MTPHTRIRRARCTSPSALPSGAGVPPAAHTRRRPSTLLFASALAASSISILAPTPLRAASLQESRASGFSGRHFDSLRFAIPPRAGDVTLRAIAAHAWTDGETHRLFLDTDVRLDLAGHRFTADRAVLWLEPFQIDPAGPTLTQIAVFFENVRDPGGPSGIAVASDRLLVTAVISGDVDLKSDRLFRGRPTDPLLPEAESRFARLINDLLYPPPPPPPPRQPRVRAPRAPTDTGSPTTTGEPAIAEAAAPGATTPAKTGPLLRPRASQSADIPPPPPQDPSLPPATYTPPRIPTSGIVSFHAENTTFIPGDDEHAIAFTGGVNVAYSEPASGRSLTLSAQRAVAFFDPIKIDNPSASPRLDAANVRGVYLEGAVIATDGRFTLRGNRMFYDPATQKALLLDAVFWTYDTLRSMPLYLRADAIRQESLRQWTAENVVVANSAFFDPHLALGATSVTITRTPRPASPTDDLPTGDTFAIDATGVSGNLGRTPILPLPAYKGDLSRPALQAISVGARDGQPVIKSTWDAFSLFGLEQLEGVNADLIIDAYVSRGPAVGIDADWTRDAHEGRAFGYLIYDNGTDDLTSGAEIDRDDDLRGLIEIEHRWRIDENWTLAAEGVYVSDPAFVDAFFPGLAESRREFTSSLYLSRRDDESLLSFETRGSFNDFSPNEWLLQSQGFNTERLPELRYVRASDSMADGLLNYNTENSVSRLQANFNEPRLNEFGFDTPARSLSGFGLLPTDSLADRLRASGLTEDAILRADTRHELSASLNVDQISITPFVVGRFTAWDDDFDTFAGSDEDSWRAFGAAGLRAATSFERVDDSVESRFLDLHRMRHIVEPSATLWHGESSRDESTIPTYDYLVDSLASGTAVRTGLTNTWQTFRGPPEERYSVDWLVVRTDLVWSDDSVNRESPIRRWVESRPELSNFGNFVENDAVLQLTDSVALSSRLVWDFEQSGLAYATGGASFDHGSGFTSFAESRYIDARDTLLVDAGVKYELSRRYAVLTAATFDIDQGDLQSIVVQLERRMPQASLEIAVGHDNITDDFAFSVAFRPHGVGPRERRRFLSTTLDVERLNDLPLDARPTTFRRFEPTFRR